MLLLQNGTTAENSMNVNRKRHAAAPGVSLSQGPQVRERHVHFSDDADHDVRISGDDVVEATQKTETAEVVEGPDEILRVCVIGTRLERSENFGLLDNESSFFREPDDVAVDLL